MQYLFEGTWAFPSTHKAVRDLETMFSKPLSAKVALKDLYPIFGTDSLFDILEDNKDSEDVRTLVKQHLKRHLKDGVAKKIDVTVLNGLRKLVGLDIEDDQKAAREQFFDEWAAFNIEKFKRVSDAADAFEKYMNDPKVKPEAKRVGMTAAIAYDMMAKTGRKFGLTEAAGKVHTLPNPGFKPRGEPEVKARAFDKVHPKTGARPDRSVLPALGAGNYHAIEFADEGDYIHVLVARDDIEMTHYSNKKDPNKEYNGIYVSFFPDGRVDADTNDIQSKRQWLKDKEKIVKVAKAALNDKDLPNVYDGLGGRSVKRGTGKLSFDTSNHELRKPGLDRHRSDEALQGAEVWSGKTKDGEFKITQLGDRKFNVWEKNKGGHFELVDSSPRTLKNAKSNIEYLSFHGHSSKKRDSIKEGNQMITFKEFLSEAKPPMKRVKEPGWYVVDHMDKAIEGPMSESGAHERAAEMNAAHAKKHGKGDITPYDALYFTDYEIRRAAEKD